MEFKIHGIVYKVTNLINSKIYIGKGIKFSNRKAHHLMLARKGEGYAFHNAIRKYGEENFSWEVIDEAYSEEELNKKECFWIEYYKSFRDYGRGYNLTKGGDGGELSEETKRKIGIANGGENSAWWGKKHSEETKKKIGLGNVGKKYSDEAKKKISKSREKYVGELHPSYGKKRSEETKERIRENHKSGKYSYKGKEVIQLTIEGNYISEFKTVAEAGKIINGNRNYISQCCRGIRDSYKGFKWIFKKDYLMNFLQTKNEGETN